MNPEDEALLAELAAALAEEPDAADVAAVGEAVWAWHDPDAALAALTMDSATEPLAGDEPLPRDIPVFKAPDGRGLRRVTREFLGLS